MQRKSWVFSLVVFTCGYAHVAVAQEITVMISGGFSAALDKLAPDYQQKSGNTLHIIHGPSMGKSTEAIPNRLAAGQKADVVIMVGYALDDLQKQGKVMPGRVLNWRTHVLAPSCQRGPRYRISAASPR
ncbi:Hypothetical ABC transport system, periplasmic component (plasmid) [Klebsiella aerogenes]|nr:Hypothetical ABC transport system, periplasmic component [Klebsiella aerogenes]